ncbi:MAG: hypothetical protein ACK5IQ_02330 [Bacteroidales bacterium]
MKILKKIDKKKRLPLILLLALLVLSATGVTNYLFEKIFYTSIKGTCQEYLARANDEADDLFIGLTAAKATVAVFEGSTMGVSAGVEMNLQAGDIVQPIYDGVDIAWKVSLMSIVSLKIQQLFFIFFELNFLKWLIVLGIIFFIPILFWKNYLTRLSHRISRFLIMMALVIYVLFPVGIWCISTLSSYVNSTYREPAAKEFQAGVDRLDKAADIFSGTDANADIDGWDWINPSAIYSKMGKKWDNLSEKIDNLKKELSSLSGSMVSNLSTIVTTFVIEVLVLPIIFLVLFWQFIRFVFKDETTNLVKRIKNE